MADSKSPLSPRALVLPDPLAVAHVAAELVVRAARTAVGSTGRFLLVLSGGSTPVSLYRLLAAPEYDERVPWRSTHVLWGDERCVAATDERSNYRLAADAGLLDRPLAGVHRMPGELSPEDGARGYEETIRRVFAGGSDDGRGGATTAGGGMTDAEVPVFDLVHLGLGEDGHTASLFPDSPALAEVGRSVVAVEPHAGTSRLSLTLPVLTDARRTLVLVTGGAKAAVLGEIMRNPDSPLPAARVVWGAPRVTLLVDEPAAAGLTEPAEGDRP